MKLKRVVELCANCVSRFATFSFALDAFKRYMDGVLKSGGCMQIYDGPEGSLVVHKDVVEGAKRGALGLGTPLKLTTDGNKREEEYEDLDEIIARFVDPYAAMCQQVTDHR